MRRRISINEHAAGLSILLPPRRARQVKRAKIFIGFGKDPDATRLHIARAFLP